MKSEIIGGIGAAIICLWWFLNSADITSTIGAGIIGFVIIEWISGIMIHEDPVDEQRILLEAYLTSERIRDFEKGDKND